jgi:hypothetical protein
VGDQLNWWVVERSILNIERQEERNPLLTSYFRDNFALEFAFARARRYRKSTGRLPYSREYYPLYSFLVSAHRVHSQLERNAKPAFEGRLGHQRRARPQAFRI